MTTKPGSTISKAFVLDTSVLIHDPECILNFEEHDVFVPLEVINELDRIKTESSERGQAARSVQRKLLLYLPQGSGQGELPTGGKIGILMPPKETTESESPIGELLGEMGTPDHRIIATAAWFKTEGERQVILVSKDMGMTLKARAAHLETEDYRFDKTQEKDGSTEEIELADTELARFVSEEYIELPEERVPAKLDVNSYGLFVANKKIPWRHTGFGRFVVVHGTGVQVPNGAEIKARNLEQVFLLDALLNPHIHLVTVAGRAGTGKAQPLYSKIAVPTGWKTMGEMKIGDPILTPNGEAGLVTGVFPQGKQPIWVVEFTDGRKIECCKDHLWDVFREDWKAEKRGGKLIPRAECKKTGWRTVTTKELEGITKRSKKIPSLRCPTVEYPEEKHTIHPYWLGAMLGDGNIGNPHLSISNSDDAVVTRFKKTMHPEYDITLKSGCDWTIHLTGGRKGKKGGYYPRELKKLSLWGTGCFTKFIPESYLLGTRKQRLELLEGLLDTDGEVDRGGCIIFSTSSKRLRNDTQRLCWSLGFICSIGEKMPTYSYKGKKQKGAKNYRLYIRANDPTEINLIPRKKANIPKNGQYKNRIRLKIVRVRKTRRTTEMQCISVSDPSRLYITDDYIVTHNTLLTMAGALEMIGSRLYTGVCISKSNEPIGKESGFLPGTIEEKMRPWLQPYADALNFLHRRPAPQNKKQSDRKTKGGNGIQTGVKRPYDLLTESGVVEITALEHIRGRSIPNRIFIVDEAQNIPPKITKTITSRIAEGSKLVYLGDLEQIDNPYLDKFSNGLSHVRAKMRGLANASHITLKKGERSLLAEQAAKLL